MISFLPDRKNENVLSVHHLPKAQLPSCSISLILRYIRVHTGMNISDITIQSLMQ